MPKTRIEREEEALNGPEGVEYWEEFIENHLEEWNGSTMRIKVGKIPRLIVLDKLQKLYQGTGFSIHAEYIDASNGYIYVLPYETGG